MDRLLILGQRDDGLFFSFNFNYKSSRLDLMSKAVSDAIGAGAVSDVGGYDPERGGVSEKAFHSAYEELLKKS